MADYSDPERIHEEQEIHETSIAPGTAARPIPTREERVVRRTTRASTSWDDLFVFDEVTMRRLTGLVVLAFGILNGLILLRFMLKLMAANPVNPFANFVYTITAPFLWIFEGLTATPSFQGIVLELHSLIAVAVYSGLAWVIIRLLWLLFARLRP
jgi:uncharacterized protein YggT (Ycf19 family)